MATPELIYETESVLLEAPNWTLDGKRLVLNGDQGAVDAEPDVAGRGP